MRIAARAPEHHQLLPSQLFSSSSFRRRYVLCIPPHGPVWSLFLTMTFTELASVAAETEPGSSKKRKLFPEASDSETNTHYRCPPIPINLAESMNPMGDPETQAGTKSPSASIALTEPTAKAASEVSDSQPNIPRRRSTSTALNPTEPTNRTSKSEPGAKLPSVKSYEDLTVIFPWDLETNMPLFTTAYHVAPDDVMYFSPENLDDSLVYIKRHAFGQCDDTKGTDALSKILLSEVLVLEQISQSPHPHIVCYYGPESTSVYLYSRISTIDKEKFVKAVESPVDHLHSLGLAHNDINLQNIMVRDRIPVLIDFGSTQPFGKSLESPGTFGWYEEDFTTSEKKHDTYALAKLRKWIQKPKGFLE
ncbi:hypothetical protein G7Y89_g6923 [Cudoniella acicularis]|uniref:Protein kinase domain-containing protein n=1 Tax=Cudoniella acicularis TaxID=354080 RepID=A0A8H4RM41_9HELO|nr:hypothetical protein G7Y89_g6923 [Cudoniella acicularis]